MRQSLVRHSLLADHMTDIDEIFALLRSVPCQQLSRQLAVPHLRPDVLTFVTSILVPHVK